MSSYEISTMEETEGEPRRSKAEPQIE